jgi:hypothetical protein
MKITRKQLIKLLREALEDYMKPVVYQDEKLRRRRQRQDVGMPGLVDKLAKLDEPKIDPVTGEVTAPDPDFVKTARNLAVSLGSKEYDGEYINLPEAEMSTIEVKRNAYNAFKSAGLNADKVGIDRGADYVLGSYFTDRFELVVRVFANYDYLVNALSGKDYIETTKNIKNNIVYSYSIYFVDDRFNDDRTRLDIIAHGLAGRNPANNDEKVLGSRFEKASLKTFKEHLDVFKFIVDNLIPISVFKNYNPENALALAMNFIALNGEKIKDENISNEEIARKVLSEAFVHKYIDTAKEIKMSLLSSQIGNSLDLARESEKYNDIFEKSVQDLESRISAGFKSDPDFALRETIVNRIIKEFKMTKDFTSMFDLDGLQAGGGDTLPPIEPPDSGGGGDGGRSGSNYPQVLVDKLVNSIPQFDYMLPSEFDTAVITFIDCNFAIGADNPTGQVQLMFSFFNESVNYTDVVDTVIMSCNNQGDVDDLFNKIIKFLSEYSGKTQRMLNDELNSSGYEFIERSFSNPSR